MTRGGPRTVSSAPCDTLFVKKETQNLYIVPVNLVRNFFDPVPLYLFTPTEVSGETNNTRGEIENPLSFWFLELYVTVNALQNLQLHVIL